jgi:hypothetical protein
MTMSNQQPVQNLLPVKLRNGTYRAALAVLFVSAIVSFWFCSRFTVDDAFISWRYGRNLVKFGIWAYNPSAFDLTQAYTNPIYAFLSVIPSYFQIDTVLFFKIVSCALGLSFSIWFAKVTKQSLLMLGALMCLPATMLHLFSGLETFLFVFLFSALLVELDRNNKKTVLLITLMLFMTRPEAWLLLVLVPTYLACHVKIIVDQIGAPSRSRLRIGRYYLEVDLKTLATSALVLGVPLAIYFGFHLHYFGSWLPNTFYIKSRATFSASDFFKFLFFMTPLTLLLLVGRKKIMCFCLTMFFAMTWSYSHSYLFMDYAARFAFHIFIPIYIYLVYLAALSKNERMNCLIKLNWLATIRLSTFINCVLLGYLAAFAIKSGIKAISLFNAYPRALEAHAALGKVIKSVSATMNVNSLVTGDAGMTAYYSDIKILDTVGLASALVAKSGLTEQVLDAYDPRIVAFYSTPTAIDMDLFGQRAIYDWAVKKGLRYQCDVYWTASYTLKLFTQTDIPRLYDVCLNSQAANNKYEEVFFRLNSLRPPWSFWRE